MTVEIIHGDCRAALEFMPSNSVHSIVTDPPYALTSISKRFGKEGAKPAAPGVYARSGAGFMGKTWDNGSTAFDPEFWGEAWRVLRPGGHVLAFGGTRTYHRLASAIEDAGRWVMIDGKREWRTLGFEIRDQIGWLYGSGFPKSHNQDGEWEGWGTALKPAWEPIVVARKALDGTNAQNLARWGVGALNIDGCRVPTDENLNGGAYAKSGGRAMLEGDERVGAAAGMFQAGKTVETEYVQPDGRWPANVIHDGSDEVLDAFPSAPGQLADASTSSSSRKTQNVYGEMKRGNGRENEASADSDNEGAVGFKMKPGARRGDTGSAARFFYCAKASKKDRDDGLEGFEKKAAGLVSNTSGQHMTRRDEGYEVEKRANTHPTVKPTDLMRYLCRLVTPPGGTVLDPFMGSGSTGRGAVLEGFNFIGCEMEAEYAAIARARIAAAAPKPEPVGVFA